MTVKEREAWDMMVEALTDLRTWAWKIHQRHGLGVLPAGSQLLFEASLEKARTTLVLADKVTR